jgi:hypothetical protein
MLAVISNRSPKGDIVFLRSANQLLLIANVVSNSLLLVNLMMEARLHPKRRFLQDPPDVTSQKTALVIVTSVKTSNLTLHELAGLCSEEVMCFLLGMNWVLYPSRRHSSQSTP